MFSMVNLQLCGSRGGGNAAATAVFWQARKGLSYTLAFETDRDRNAAIMLARKFASNCNVSAFALKLHFVSNDNVVKNPFHSLDVRKQVILYPFVCSMQITLTGPGDEVHAGS